MDIEPKFTFVSVPDKNYSGFGDRDVRDFIVKWGLHFVIQNFLFNENFHPYHKHHLAQEFFSSKIVAKNLKNWHDSFRIIQNSTTPEVDSHQIPCSVLNMSFFDKLKDPQNNIVYDSGSIRQRYDVEINGILVSDNLRGMLLDEESEEYNLYSKSERDEFIFRIFQILVLGGEYCQYEENLQPYLDCTKKIYKDLIKVQKMADSNDLNVSTMVLQVKAKTKDVHFPKDPDHIQNASFLLIDINSREITTLSHQFCG